MFNNLPFLFDFYEVDTVRITIFVTLTKTIQTNKHEWV